MARNAWVIPGPCLYTLKFKFHGIFWIWPEGQVCTLFLADPTYGGLKKTRRSGFADFGPEFRGTRSWPKIPRYWELAENSAVLGVGRWPKIPLQLAWSRGVLLMKVMI